MADGKEMKKYAKSSVYLITVNPNLRFNSDTDPQLKRWYHKLDNACRELGLNIKEYIKLKKQALDRGDTLSSKYISLFEWQYALELGPETKCLHGHMYLKLRHKTTLELDYAKIKGFFIKKLDRNVYFQGRVASSASINFKEYVNKGKLEIKPE